MLIDSEIFTEVNATEGMADLDSDLDSVQTRVALNVAPAMALLDASSLNTVLAMLEVIDSAEELALLETLTPEQKRQVWDATPAATRIRLKQLRSKTEPHTEPHRGSEPEFTAQALNATEEGEDALDEAELLESEETSIELELSEALDAAPLGSESADLVPQVKLAIGDWIVLQAKPQLSAAELTAIWEVLEVQGQSARIIASKLGIRTYPIAWMMPYPKPIGYVEPEF